MKNLKYVRNAKGYSQAQLAQFLHVGSSTVCRWELGQTKPSLCQFLMLCKILNCKPAQLCDEFTHSQIPVFDIENSAAAGYPLTDELKGSGCSFGLILPFDIYGRFKKGDICYFSLEAADVCDEKPVLAFDDNYNEYIYPFKDHNSNLQIIATCNAVYTKI